MVDDKKGPAKANNYGWLLGISFGVVIGISLGLAMDNLVAGIGIGLAIGIAFGIAFTRSKDAQESRAAEGDKPRNGNTQNDE